MVLLLRRSRVNAVAMSMVVFLSVGLAAAALDERVVGRAVVGVPESLFHYLLPYYTSFRELHPAAEIEFYIIGDSDIETLAGLSDSALSGGFADELYDQVSDRWLDEVSGSLRWDGLSGGVAGGRSNGLREVHAWIAAEASAPQLQSAFERVTGTRLTVTKSFHARFAPVVSAFNPVETVSIEILEMAMEGEITDWASLEPGWIGDITFATYDCNPAESIAQIGAGGQGARPFGGPHGNLVQKRHANQIEFVEYLRFEPFAVGLVPLSAIAPGVNPVRVTGETGVRDGCVVSTVSVLEPTELPLLARLLSWISSRLGHTRVLRAFLDHIEQLDASLLGADAVTLVAVGDIMLDRGVRLAMNKHGLTYPFEGTQQVLSSANIAFANLEAPISSRGNPLNMFRAYPDVMKALRYSGLDVVSIANNHILDYDYVALHDTLEYLEADGIHYVGAGPNESAARRYRVIESNGIRIAFLAYTELWFCYTKDNRSVDATESRPGVAPLREDVLVEDIVRAKADSDFIVVSCHWGEEYNHYPNEMQRRFAEIATAAGADLVLGHHPHVLQGLLFGDYWVTAYSLGNFVFDQRQPGTQDSVILRFTISRARAAGIFRSGTVDQSGGRVADISRCRVADVSGGRIIRVDVLPCYIVDCQPVLLTGDARRRALLEMSRLSSGLVNSSASSGVSWSAGLNGSSDGSWSAGLNGSSDGSWSAGLNGSSGVSWSATASTSDP